MAGVRFRDLRKSFGAAEVIRGVDVDIPSGAFVSLVGPSGCGKSTLLRMLAGLEEVTSGRIEIGGRLVNLLRAKDRDVAMVFQNYALYPHMTVAENMGFALRLRGDGPEAMARRVRPAAEMLGLTPLLDRHPKDLSGGQRQRVAMGRAIVRDPAVFLFDEPLSNLDAKLRVQMRAEIKALHRRLGTTTVFVTHDQVEAMTMSDSIVVLREGRVEQVGAPLELFDHPANLFVAEFIGSPSMNLMPGVVADGGRRVALGEDQGVALSARAPLPDGARVVCGVRPEHLAVADAPTGLSARVTVVEPLGDDAIVAAMGPTGPITVLARDRRPLAPDDVIHLAPAPGRTHLFEPETERALAPAHA